MTTEMRFGQGHYQCMSGAGATPPQGAAAAARSLPPRTSLGINSVSVVDRVSTRVSANLRPNHRRERANL